MSKPFREELLSGYVDGELSPRDRAAVEAHLAATPAAAAEVDELRWLDALVAGVRPPRVAGGEWAAAWSSIAERIAAPRPQAAARAGRRGRLRGLWWVAAAAALVLAVGLSGWLGSGPRTTPPSPETAVVCQLEHIEVADGYVSMQSHDEDGNVTLVTVLSLEPEELAPDGERPDPL